MAAPSKQTVNGSEVPQELSVHWRDLSVRFRDRGGRSSWRKRAQRSAKNSWRAAVGQEIEAGDTVLKRAPRREVLALAPCSGDVEAGRAVALMGPTGCGKTSLLNAMARRGPVSSGQVWYGKDLAWSSSLKRHVAFIEQDDLTFAGLTVRESLTFSARLRLAGMPLAQKLEQVERSIELLRLQSCADTVVSSTDGKAKTISGGERKRLMVGQEMLTSPRLICCDEPTSGLDSSTACAVVDALRDLARRKRVAVIASIHQPSSRLFLAFDDLYLLRKGGAVYRGPTAEAGGAFAEAPFSLPTPDAYSAPDWLMEIVVDGRVFGDEARLAALVERYGPASLPAHEGKLRELRATRRRHKFAAPLTEQVAVLAKRTWRGVKGNVFKRTALMLHCGNATISGLMWFQLGTKESDIWARYTIAFAIPIAWVFFPLLESLGVVPASEAILKKELAVNAYRLEAWAAVFTTMALIPMFVQSFIFLTIFFTLSGISSNILVFLALYAVVVGSLLTFQSIGLFFSAAVDEKELTTIAMLYVTFCFLFTGLFVPLKDTAIPFVAYVNPLLYIFKLSAEGVFGIDRLKFDCDNSYEDEDGSMYPDSCGAGGDGDVSVTEIYRYYKLDKISTPWAVAALAIIFIAGRVGAYYYLRRKMRTHFKEMHIYEITSGGVEGGAKVVDPAEVKVVRLDEGLDDDYESYPEEESKEAA